MAKSAFPIIVPEVSGIELDREDVLSGGMMLLAMSKTDFQKTT